MPKANARYRKKSNKKSLPPHFWTEEKKAKHRDRQKQKSNDCLTAPLRYGGGSANINSSAINKRCAFRQVSTSNPPQRKAANRYVYPSKARPCDY